MDLILFCLIAEKADGGSRTEEEERVYSWLYALARSDRNLVFEYVRSTELGRSMLNFGLILISIESRIISEF